MLILPITVQMFFPFFLSFSILLAFIPSPHLSMPFPPSSFYLGRRGKEDGWSRTCVKHRTATELHPCSTMDVSFTFGHRFIGYSPQTPGAKAKETPQTVLECAQTLKCPVSSFKNEDLNSWRLRKRSHSNRWGL